MSLINEALKKAQRRNDAAAGLPSSGPIAKRAEPKSARSTLVLVAGAVVLVVLSMVITAWWVTRPVSPPPVPVMVAAAPPAPAPKVVVPIMPPPTTAVADVPPIVSAGRMETAESPLHATGAPIITAAKPPTQPLANPAEDHLIAKAAPPPSPPKPDERVQEYVQSLRVMGIRSSGSDSRVLMNDRVFRVNDIVDRTMGLRLTKVSADSLTFTDANGAVYVKYF